MNFRTKRYLHFQYAIISHKKKKSYFLTEVKLQSTISVHFFKSTNTQNVWIRKSNTKKKNPLLSSSVPNPLSQSNKNQWSWGEIQLLIVCKSSYLVMVVSWAGVPFFFCCMMRDTKILASKSILSGTLSKIFGFSDRMAFKPSSMIGRSCGRNFAAVSLHPVNAKKTYKII